MFSMLDFPRSSLGKYSSDPVQGKIYTSEELTHTNGILTDHDVIEDVTPESNRKSITLSAPVYKPVINDDLKKPNANSKKKGGQLQHLPQSSTDAFAKTKNNKFLLTLGRKLNNGKKGGLYESRFYSGSSERNPKNSLRLNYITDAQDNSYKGIKTASRGDDRASKPKNKSKVDLLYQIQKSVALERQPVLDRHPTRSMVPRDKILRSPPARRYNLRDLLAKRAKSISKKRVNPGRPVRNPSFPSERDFFFFKDAFEYGAKFLAKKFISNEEPDTIALNEDVRTAAPETKPTLWKNDFEKIKNEVKDNFAKQFRLAGSKTKSSTDLGPTSIPVPTPSTSHQKPSTSQNDQKLNLIHENGKPLLVLNMTTNAPKTSNKSPKTASGKKLLKVYSESTQETSTSLLKSKVKTIVVPLVTTVSGKTTQTKTTSPIQQVRKILNMNKLQTKRIITTKLSTGLNIIPAKKTSQVITQTTQKPIVATTLERRTTLKKSSPSKYFKDRLSNQAKNNQVKTTKVIVDSKLSNRLIIKSQKKKSRNRVTRVYKPEPRVYKIPESRMPSHYYRKPCPSKVDAMFKGQGGKIYAIDGDLVYVLDRYGIERGPLPINFVWPYVEAPIQDGHFRTQDGKTILFFKNKYAVYMNDRDLITPPNDIQALGLPSAFGQVDAVASWTGNGRTYFFKGNQYWKYNDYYQKLETGYPRSIQRYWHGVPDDVDTAFIAPNSYLYFIKDGLIYKMNYYGASVQYQYPKKLSESCYDFFI
eukprot:gene2852-1088_t